MKKISVMALIGVLSAGAAMAEFIEPTVAAPAHNAKGGFVNPTETITKVSRVNEMRDDVFVIVQGNIVQSLGDEKYLFEDPSGSIVVEIDDDAWRGQVITPADTVKLRGDVDRGIFKTEIELESVEKL